MPNWQVLRWSDGVKAIGHHQKSAKNDLPASCAKRPWLPFGDLCAFETCAYILPCVRVGAKKASNFRRRLTPMNADEVVLAQCIK